MGLDAALKYASNYISTRSQWATDLGKPIVLEEYGMARDAWKSPSDDKYKYDPSTTTEHKDSFFDQLLSQIAALVKHGSFSGSNFWSYSGTGRSTDLPNSYSMVWVGGKQKKEENRVVGCSPICFYRPTA
jgi:mannan endo-1,4-beta-mannosidase